MLRIRDLRVRFGTTEAVRGVDLDAPRGQVTCLLGPSGCGKSTVLRAVAGLDRVEAGAIELEGRDLAGLRPDQRGVGLMFQDYALFPHRHVRDNVAFGLRMQGVAREERRRRVDEALDLVGLADYESRPVAELSGGEQQRVALARAIAPSPRLLMLDEPLGSVDRALRDRLLRDLPRVFAEIDATVLYVTHDQEEALTLADRVAVMRAGRVEQAGSPTDVWAAPRTLFVARFLGMRNELDGDLEADGVETALGRFPAPRGATRGPATVVVPPGALRLLGGSPTGDPRAGRGEKVAGARPRGGDVEGDANDDGVRVVSGQVEARAFVGDHVVLTVRTEAGPSLETPVWGPSAPPIGQDVRLAVTVDAALAYPASSRPSDDAPGTTPSKEPG